MKQICALEEKQGEKYYMSWFGNQRKEVPGESGSFFMCFSIFFITSVSPVSSDVTLWLQKSISLAALLLSVQLILNPTIHSFYSPDVFSLPSIFRGHPKCDHIVHFSTLFGSVIRDHLHPENLPSKNRPQVSQAFDWHAGECTLSTINTPISENMKSSLWHINMIGLWAKKATIQTVIIRQNTRWMQINTNMKFSSWNDMINDSSNESMLKKKFL